MSKSRAIIFWLVLGIFSISIGFVGRLFIEEKYRIADQKTDDYIDIAAEEAKRTKAEKEYITAMTADTYGGQTPEETLQLFIEALKAGDIELASKYFALETNTQDPNYLTRKKWEDYLKSIQERNLSRRMAEDIERDVKPLSKAIENNRFSFALFNEDGTVGISIDLKFNQYSQVWKIESL